MKRKTIAIIAVFVMTMMLLGTFLPITQGAQKDYYFLPNAAQNCVGDYKAGSLANLRYDDNNYYERYYEASENWNPILMDDVFSSNWYWHENDANTIAACRYNDDDITTAGIDIDHEYRFGRLRENNMAEPEEGNEWYLRVKFRFTNIRDDIGYAALVIYTDTGSERIDYKYGTFSEGVWYTFDGWIMSNFPDYICGINDVTNIFLYTSDYLDDHKVNFDIEVGELSIAELDADEAYKYRSYVEYRIPTIELVGIQFTKLKVNFDRVNGGNAGNTGITYVIKVNSGTWASGSVGQGDGLNLGESNCAYTTPYTYVKIDLIFYDDSSSLSSYFQLDQLYIHVRTSLF